MTNPQKIFDGLMIKAIGNLLPDKIYIELLYRYTMGRWPNLKEPKTFTEKLQWLKLNERNSLYPMLVDKISVKDWVSSKIGKEYIIPTLCIWDRAEDINCEILPNQFVLKCNHDSGGIIICRDKESFDKKSAVKLLNKSLKKKYYLKGREWPYKLITPRVFAEMLISDHEGHNDLKDYKFFVFNGKVKFFKIDFGRFIEHHANYYDREGNLLPFGEAIFPPKPGISLKIPNNLLEMITIAEKLSTDTTFVRIDLYNIDGRIYFGEMTFFPASGFGRFVPEDYDYMLGKLLDLPIDNKIDILP